MGTMSIRMPEALEKDLKEFAKEETFEQTSDAARKLIAKGIANWRKERAFQRFIEGKCTFLKAAAMAQLSPWEFANLLQEKKVPWITDIAQIAEDIAKAKV